MTSSRLCGQLSGWPLLIIFALACSGRTDEPDPGGGSGGVHYDGGAPGAGGRMSGGQPGSGGDGGDESGGNDAGPDDGGAPPASSGGASSGGSSDGSAGEDESGGLSGTGGDATTSAYTVCDEELGEENNPLCGSAMICRSGYCTP
ncbi:MAG TPA: hypothetical protein VN764_00890, partial [Polyangiaceae bacterium]|nr:hypothetical protein [Polyangiaceae bacterium]